MGKLIKARTGPKGYGIFGRAMNIKDPQAKAALLQKAALKLAEFREANAGLARENERLKLTLDAALRRIAEFEGKEYPPKDDAQAEAEQSE